MSERYYIGINYFAVYSGRTDIVGIELESQDYICVDSDENSAQAINSINQGRREYEEIGWEMFKHAATVEARVDYSRMYSVNEDGEIVIFEDKKL